MGSLSQYLFFIKPWMSESQFQFELVFYFSIAQKGGVQHAASKAITVKVFNGAFVQQQLGERQIVSWTGQHRNT